jgi:branched-chain amino acid transport system permease protein
MAMRAIEQDSETAVMLGIRINHVNLFGFVVACGLAGAGGVLISLVFVVSPVMGSEFLLKAFVVIILGGAGSIMGCVAGSLLLGFADSFAGTLFGAHIAYGIGFALIIVVLLIRPTGLVGYAQK